MSSIERYLKLRFEHRKVPGTPSQLSRAGQGEKNPVRPLAVRKTKARRSQKKDGATQKKAAVKSATSPLSGKRQAQRRQGPFRAQDSHRSSIAATPSQ